MSTNYYLRTGGECPHCGHEADDLHIGKHSQGWKFMFHHYPELGLDSWSEWWRKILYSTVDIVDEYGQVLTFKDLTDIVEDAQIPENLDADNAPVSAYGPYTMEERKTHQFKDKDGYVFIRGEEWS